MLEKISCYVKRLSILLITVALIAGMVGCSPVGCGPSTQNLEIRDWYDLDDIRDNLGGSHLLMNDLDSTTAGYEDLASPTANQGKGWQPIIGTGDDAFTGTFDGQRYEIRDLFINRPDEYFVGLFGIVAEGGVIKNVGVVNADVTGNTHVSGLAGGNMGTVSNSYSTGSVTGVELVGSLVGFNNQEGTVSNSYFTGNVTGDVGVGGLLGASSGTVSNSYSTGSVTGNDDVGGLVGYYEGTMSNSFWDKETSGIEVSDGGTGKTTAEMQNIATFSGAAWDIIAVVGPGEPNPTSIWNIVDGETYPFLSWEP